MSDGVGLLCQVGGSRSQQVRGVDCWLVCWLAEGMACMAGVGERASSVNRMAWWPWTAAGGCKPVRQM